MATSRLRAFNFQNWIREHQHLLKPPVGNKKVFEDGDMTVQEIAQPFAMSLPAVSQHLKVLERAGLISRRREGQRRPCHLRVERLAEAARWFEHTRQAWQARLDRLEHFLASVESSQPNETKGDTSGTP